MQELERRLTTRNQDSETTIAKRLAAADAEIAHCPEFDYVVVNDKFEVTLVDLRSIIRSKRLLTEVQINKQQKLLAELTQNR